MIDTRVILGSLFLAFALLGCGKVYSITEPDPYYPATVKLKPEEKHVWKIVDISPYRNILYVRHQDPRSLVKPFKGGLPEPLSTFKGKPATWVTTSKSELDEFFRASFENIGYFNAVKNYEDLGENINTKNPKYLIAEYATDWQGAYDITFHIRIVRPDTEEVLLHVSHYHYRFWPSLDRPLFFPVFNTVIDWKNECIAKMGAN